MRLTSDVVKKAGATKEAAPIITRYIRKYLHLTADAPVVLQGTRFQGKDLLEADGKPLQVEVPTEPEASAPYSDEQMQVVLSDALTEMSSAFPGVNPLYSLLKQASKGYDFVVRIASKPFDKDGAILDLAKVLMQAHPKWSPEKALERAKAQFEADSDEE